ncbi:PIG-L deacetylase family protein [Clostridium botulinum]|uniref:GlcNAc-PI de-N-acetylase n=1 Tax=Clostridium botulinum TaxID=1491 RepID=A0A9Q1V131_CLOBO|nr:PIG-L family deacetylase [Clostridium botulinum]AEB75797.1 GlcNAc-PI de-N-acetylase family protein [Clostridium botulinum BKT015925]KEH98587.1 GlcNAc-PI de-N-acetylase [Clostridium botulinum D str. 16868]KEI05749.1 GlcNAc-PI de-N-acetylase [Clostridium botulinum C/D str. Sp77]KLU75629.1 GlcNAc-PI de-N-acetylase [Clostridium botulinum V891]KOA75298.1 GlcNAc-PI de-N-acetylase [Clostridium botulinum]
MKKRVLVVSVHPDDETLGCGGTLLKHRDNGDELSWLIVTKASSKLGFSEEFLVEREIQVKKVSEKFKFENVYKLGYYTTKLHTMDFSELILNISNVINDIRPQIIYINNKSDIHTDHQVVAKAMMSCTKSFRYPFIERILMYECISETEMAPPFIENIFIPNVYSDISDFIEKKLEIMSIYKSEVQESPLPRSLDNIKALARYRGASCGEKYAEAFMIVREKF